MGYIRGYTHRQALEHGTHKKKKNENKKRDINTQVYIHQHTFRIRLNSYIESHIYTLKVTPTLGITHLHKVKHLH